MKFQALFVRACRDDRSVAGENVVSIKGLEDRVASDALSGTRDVVG